MGSTAMCVCCGTQNVGRLPRGLISARATDRREPVADAIGRFSKEKTQKGIYSTRIIRIVRSGRHPTRTQDAVARTWMTDDDMEGEWNVLNDHVPALVPSCYRL